MSHGGPRAAKLAVVGGNGSKPGAGDGGGRRCGGRAGAIDFGGGRLEAAKLTARAAGVAEASESVRYVSWSISLS